MVAFRLGSGGDGRRSDVDRSVRGLYRACQLSLPADQQEGDRRRSSREGARQRTPGETRAHYGFR